MDCFDFYGAAKTPIGYYVTKNGELFLECTGGKEEAEKIAKTLNEDVRRLSHERKKMAV